MQVNRIRFPDRRRDPAFAQRSAPEPTLIPESIRALSPMTTKIQPITALTNNMPVSKKLAA